MPADPRRTYEPNAQARFAAQLRSLRADVDRLQRSSNLRNAAISGGDGLAVLDVDGNTVLRLSTTDGGGVVAYRADGSEAARFGPLFHTVPGEFGVEVDAGDSWVRLGYQSASWAQIAGRPGVTGGATIPGSFISSAVAAATTAATAGSASTAGSATTAGKASQADGSQYAFDNNVAGTSFAAVWVGNDGGYHFGRNVSSRKYKENIREAGLGPALLDLQPVRYDRRPSYRAAVTADGEPAEGPEQMIPGAVNEFGLIAEDVHEHLPEVVTWWDGQIDGVRYDLLGVAAIPVLQDHEARIAKLEELVTAQAGLIEALTNGRSTT